MKKLGVIILLFLTTNFSFAQTKSVVKLKTTDKAKVIISTEKLKSTIDLSENVAGCAWVKKGTHIINNSDCSAPSANYKLLDSNEKGKQFYLLILSEAMGNCNVCGRGGGTNSFALIWLKLDSTLKLIQKKSVPIFWERAETYIVKPKPTYQGNLKILKPKFVKDILTVEFEKVNFDNSGKPSGFDFSHLEYNRSTPEKAFIIKTEKRKTSANTGK